ncbi:DUF2325 domain-containing protein [Paenibacillus oralis]|nr:DUF2325 domain-containing protein [Paenibacillus oralis]
MVGKAVLKILSMLSGEFESKVLADGFKRVLIKQMGRPFPSRQLSNLLREMPVQKKRSFSLFMNIPIRQNTNHPFPDDKFVTLVRVKMKSQSDKAKFIQGMINIVIDIYGDIEQLSASNYLLNEEEKTKEFGPWHYYWGLRLFPIESDAIEKRLTDLEALLPDASSHDEKIHDINVIRINPNQWTKESKENSLVSKERELRQKAEQEAARLKSQVRLLEKNNDRLRQEKEVLFVEKNQRDKKLKDTEELLGLERKKTHSLERVKIELQYEIKKLERSVKHLVENEKKLLKKFEEEMKALREEMSVPDLQMTDMVEKLIVALNIDVDTYFAQLRSGQASRQDQAIFRKKVKDYFDLIESLEAYLSLVAVPALIPLPDETALETVQSETIDSQNEFQQHLKERPTVENQETPERFLGTFYRKDHGGYIACENNEIFNITESMVNSIGLEHEAEVECEPFRRGDGSTQYNIRLLFQGDDAYAPITRYMGYVELREHFSYYCVDINNSNNRFPIYEKDVEIQQPKDGDPCLFNVAIDGEYARLSKIYKQPSVGSASKDLKVKEKSIRTTTSRKNELTKQEAFLQGCKIVIVGGLEKWFETVVKETGAELYHENGDRPERIHPKLRRADALFLLQTATSHDATWSCIEIAKEYNVPHFKIEGSKSNLRKLLWDNRDKIRNEAIRSA